MNLPWLSLSDRTQFPPVTDSLEESLLAVGGDLSSTRILNAYKQGIFPWFNEGDPILWWSPDPRLVLFTDEVKISKSLKKSLRKSTLSIRFDTAFKQVMLACSAPRSDTDSGTWIHPEMIDAYVDLHQLGHAHSIECWQGEQLVGGLYGIAIGKMFFGESMFSTIANSSKIALVTLCQQLHRWGFELIDCQVYSDHLASLGAVEIDRSIFMTHINTACQQPHSQPWSIDNG